MPPRRRDRDLEELDDDAIIAQIAAAQNIDEDQVDPEAVEAARARANRLDDDEDDEDDVGNIEEHYRQEVVPARAAARVERGTRRALERNILDFENRLEEIGPGHLHHVAPFRLRGRPLRHEDEEYDMDREVQEGHILQWDRDLRDRDNEVQGYSDPEPDYNDDDKPARKKKKKSPKGGADQEVPQQDWTQHLQWVQDVVDHLPPAVSHRMSEWKIALPSLEETPDRNKPFQRGYLRIRFRGNGEAFVKLLKRR